MIVFGGRDGQLDPKKKVIFSYKEITRYAEACRVLGARIVVTIGSWDVLHIGHVRYLIEASRFGDVLVVGVDSDLAVKAYKGEGRPVFPQQERIEMISYLGCVNVVTLVTDVDKKGCWQYGLIKAIRPEVFIAVEDSYPEEQRQEIRQHVGNLIVLPRQAEDTSSTDIIQRIIKGELLKEIRAREEKTHVG